MHAPERPPGRAAVGIARLQRRLVAAEEAIDRGPVAARGGSVQPGLGQRLRRRRHLGDRRQRTERQRRQRPPGRYTRAHGAKRWPRGQVR
jgi:hypothetical protein